MSPAQDLAWADRFAQSQRRKTPRPDEPQPEAASHARPAAAFSLALARRTMDGLGLESVELPDGDVMLVWRRGRSATGGPQSASRCSLTLLERPSPASDTQTNALDCVLEIGARADWDQLSADPARVVVQLTLGEATSRALQDACGPDAAEELRRSACVLPLGQRHAQVLHDILSPDIPSRLRSAYLSAKGAELVCLLIAAAARRAERMQSRPNLRRSDLAKAERARQILLQELQVPPRLERLARRVGLNRSKLAACFKHLYGCGVYEFSRRERLLLARRLLSETEASVLQIAAATGYETIASFSKSFRAEFGINPRACRAGAGASA